MDEMKKEEIKAALMTEDLKNLYSTLSYALGCGGEVWLEVKHGRTKRIIEESKIHLSSPIFNQYSKMMEGELKAKENKIKSLEKDLRDKDDTINSIENSLREKDSQIEKGLRDMDAKLKEKDKEIMDLKSRIEKEREEHKDIGDSYVEYILSIEEKIKELEQITEEARKQGFKGKGKSTELPPRVVREVVRLWALGESIKSIEASTGASRGQINRVIHGAYKTEASRKKVLKAVNHLLKVNQNKDFIEKLKGLKSKYE